VPLMTDILIRLHLNRIIITGDYRKASLHIKIALQDRNHRGSYGKKISVQTTGFYSIFGGVW